MRRGQMARGGFEMAQQASKGRRARRPAGVAPGEFGHLLAEIEKEAVPERLLDLALQLQAALVRRRSVEEDEPSPTGRHAGVEPSAG